MLRTQLRFIFVLALLLRTQQALAAPTEYFWNNTAGGDYATPDNWTPSGPPSPSDDAIFDLGSSGYDVTVSAPTTARQLLVASDNVNLNIAVSTNVLTLFDPDDATTNTVVVGDQSGQVGKLTVKPGTLEGSNSVIGNAAGSQGTLTVDGAAGAATFANHGELAIGRNGAGTLNVKAGASSISVGAVKVGQFSGSTGNLNVDGTGSQFSTLDALAVGGDGPSGGTGNLSITNGGSVSAALGTKVGGVGSGAGSGSVTVDGSGSTFQPGSLTVGAGGNGTFTLQNGAKATPTGVIIGAGGVGQITVSGAGSSLTPSGPLLEVGTSASGSGTLLVENGATSQAQAIRMGTIAGSSGTITVTGAGSKLDAVANSSLTIGDRGEATLEVLNGGTFTHFTQDVILGRFSPGSGSVVVDGAGSAFITSTHVLVGGQNIPFQGAGGNGHLTVSDGGTFTLGGNMTVSRRGVVDVQGGTLNVGNSVANLGTVNLNGTINGDFSNSGLLTGEGTINGELSIGGTSTVSPGNSPGTLTAGDTVWSGNGLLKFEIDSALGTVGDNWDLLNITGALDFNVTEQDFLIDLTSLLPDGSAGALSDFDPSQEYAWTFAKAAGGITNFATENFTVLTGNFGNTFDDYFSVIQVGNELQLLYSVPEPSTIVSGAIGLALVLGAVQK